MEPRGGERRTSGGAASEFELAFLSAPGVVPLDNELNAAHKPVRAPRPRPPRRALDAGPTGSTDGDEPPAELGDRQAPPSVCSGRRRPSSARRPPERRLRVPGAGGAHGGDELRRALGAARGSSSAAAAVGARSAYAGVACTVQSSPSRPGFDESLET